MTTYNTGNPLGSSDPRDLYDNAENLDSLVNGDQPAYNDRMGRSRRSWQSVEDQANQQEAEFNADQAQRVSEFNAAQSDREGVFNAYLVSAGYQFAGDYAAGIEITQFNQVIRDASGELWRVSGSTTLPYTTTGAGLPEGGAFVAVGDAVLRQELADPDKGAEMVGYKGGTVAGSLEDLASRELHFSDHINVMDGAADNTADFLSALTLAAGRRIVLNSGEIIRLTAPVDAGNIPVNIYGLGGEIRFDHDDYGILTTGSVTLDGVLTMSGMDRAHRAVDMLGIGKFVKIMDGVHFENFFGADNCIVVRSIGSYNYIKASFNRIRCYEPAAGAAENIGILRAVYLGGPRAYSVFDNIRVTDCNNVDRDTGEITCHGADAIQCQNGVHFIEFISGEFDNVGKRWLKLQGTAGSKAVIHSMTGRSAFVGTPDGIENVHNGMYACVSVYGGDLEIKSLTLREGSCLYAVSVGDAAAGRVLVNGLNYTPEYKKYVVGILTRTILVELNAVNTDLEWGSGFSKNTWNGVESFPNNPRVNLHNVKMEVRRTAVETQSKELQVNNTNLVVIGPDGRWGIHATGQTKQVFIQNNNIEGEFTSGILLSDRTDGLHGSISGNTAANVTSSVLTNYTPSHTTQLAIGTNFGPGTTNTQQIATRHNFRNESGVDQVIISDSGVSFKPVQASSAVLGGSANRVNLNKFPFQCVYNTTTQKLMVAQTDGTWVSVDGVDVITPA